MLYAETHASENISPEKVSKWHFPRYLGLTIGTFYYLKRALNDDSILPVAECYAYMHLRCRSK